MISLAGRDILHAWGKFVFTGIGLGLLIGVTLTMAGVYRGMVDDGRALLDNSGADLWVVQQGTLGPYAEPSSLNDNTWRSLRALPGVQDAANVTYLTMQVRQGERDVRAMVVGIAAGAPGTPAVHTVADARDCARGTGGRLVSTVTRPDALNALVGVDEQLQAHGWQLTQSQGKTGDVTASYVSADGHANVQVAAADHTGMRPHFTLTTTLGCS